MTRQRIAAALVTMLGLLGAATGPASADTASLSTTFKASDGVTLRGTLSGQAPLTARPTIVEFSPYGIATGAFKIPPQFNSLVIEDRGTGRSGGSFDALGPRIQQDVSETLAWACKQPWSNGTLGLAGFSASAITIYNSLHLPLACVKAAVLGSGTFELYRDLLTPGGISNTLPGAVVIFGIGGGALQAGAQRNPLDTPAALLGDVGAGLNVATHPTLDTWWAQRGFRGNVNHIPVLMLAGFFDVESRGAFQGYQALKGDGAHLVVSSGHDQAPKGTDGGRAEGDLWFDHFLRGTDNGVERHPRVQMVIAKGDRSTFVRGEFLRRDATDWPVAGTRWQSFALDAAKSGTAASLNDGSLTTGAAPAAASTQAYPAAVSVPTQTDVPNAAVVDGAGFSALSGAFPALTDMRTAEPLGLSYTSPPLKQDMLAVGPAALHVRLATTGPSAAIWAVLSDVDPAGVPHPIALGRLSTDFPEIDRAKSLIDPTSGEVVQPYGVYSKATPATPGTARTYDVELWPVGNAFAAGHRIRLHLVGQSLASLPKLPAFSLVTVGGADPSRLLLPMIPAQEPVVGAAPRRCAGARRFTVHVRARYRRALRSAVVRVDGRTIARLRGGRTSVPIDLRKSTRRIVRLAITMRLAGGRVVVDRRTYHPCGSGRR